MTNRADRGEVVLTSVAVRVRLDGRKAGIERAGVVALVEIEGFFFDLENSPSYSQGVPLCS
jgi:hypothetical protein